MNRSSLRRSSTLAPSNWRFPGEPNLDSRIPTSTYKSPPRPRNAPVFLALTPHFWLIWTAVFLQTFILQTIIYKLRERRFVRRRGMDWPIILEGLFIGVLGVVGIF